MDFVQVVILSAVEGVAEFLPISSTGHLVLVSNLLGIVQSDFVKSFEIFIQLGAIMAVVVLYWKKFLSGIKIWKTLVTAMIPTLMVGLFLYKFIKSMLIGNMLITVLALIIGGAVMIVIEKYYFNNKRVVSDNILAELSWKKALWVGVGQSIAVVPGVSRSASTIFGGMLVGLNRETAVEFSFLLAVPTMLAATGLDMFKFGFNFSGNEVILLLVGFLGSFITSIVTVRWLIKFVAKNNFVGFGMYRIVFGVLYWLLVIR